MSHSLWMYVIGISVGVFVTCLTLNLYRDWW